MNDEIRVPEPVIEACRQLYELRLAIAADADVRRARRRVQDTHRLYQDATNDLERLENEYQPKIEEIEEYISSHTLEVGRSFDSSGVKVKFVKGHERVSYSKKAIDQYIKDDPSFEDLISFAREVKTIKPRVTIVSD
jgi:hypothetical protein